MSISEDLRDLLLPDTHIVGSGDERGLENYGSEDVRPTAQCERCGRDFRPDDDPFSPDHDLCPSCTDHAVLCGCNDEYCDL